MYSTGLVKIAANLNPNKAKALYQKYHHKLNQKIFKSLGPEFQKIMDGKYNSAKKTPKAFYATANKAAKIAKLTEKYDKKLKKTVGKKNHHSDWYRHHIQNPYYKANSQNQATMAAFSNLKDNLISHKTSILSAKKKQQAQALANFRDSLRNDIGASVALHGKLRKKYSY
jgi:hypothetical protein